MNSAFLHEDYLKVLSNENYNNFERENELQIVREDLRQRAKRYAQIVEEQYALALTISKTLGFPADHPDRKTADRFLQLLAEQQSE